MDKLIDKLTGNQYIIVLDRASEYYQICMAEDYSTYTAFIDTEAQYECVKMPL